MFILGFDTDTKETFKETEKFIKASNLSEVQITLLTPFPGTNLHNQLKKENRLLSDNYWDKCTLFDVNFIPKKLTVKELEDEFQNLVTNIYSAEVEVERKNKFRQILKNKSKLD